MEEAFDAAALTEEPEEDAREERVFRSWLNSLGLQDGTTFVRSLADDLCDGAVLIDAIVAIAGDAVSIGARKVNRGVLNQFKRVRATFDPLALSCCVMLSSSVLRCCGNDERAQVY